MFIKSQLFKSLYEARKPKKPVEEPNPSEDAEDIEAGEQAGWKIKRPSKSNKGKIFKSPVQAAVDAGKTTKPGAVSNRVEKVAIKDVAKNEEAKGKSKKSKEEEPFKDSPKVKGSEAFKPEDLKSKYLKTKSEYGNAYMKNRQSVADLYADVENIPFRLSAKKSRNLFKYFSEVLLDSENAQIREDEQSQPAFKELLDILRKGGVGGLHSNEGYNNIPTYVLFMVLVFPLIQPDMVSYLFSKPNIANFFNTLSKTYSGNILNPISFSPNTDLSSLDQIKDEYTRLVVEQFQNMLRSNDPEQQPEKVELARYLQEVTSGLSQSFTKSIGSYKHKNEITKTIYYAIAGGYVPENLDYFELDDKKVQDYFNNKSLSKEQSLLTDAAEQLVYHRSESIEESPALNKNLAGMNARNELAWKYALETNRLQRKRKNKEIERAEKTRSINLGTFEYFKELSRAIPQINENDAKLTEILNNMFNFGEGLTTLSVESVSKKTTNDLHNFAKEGMDLISAIFSNDALLLKTFNNVAEKIPVIKQSIIESEDRIAYVRDTYLAPFKTQLSTILKNFAAITEEDVSILLNTVISITNCIGKQLEPFKLKPILYSYETHLKKAELRSNIYRLDGFAFLRSVLNLDSLLIEAGKITKKAGKVAKQKEEKPTTDQSVTAGEEGAEFKTGVLLGSKRSSKQLQAARREIMETKAVLTSLRSVTARLLDIIRQKIEDADLKILNALVSGATEEEDIVKVSEFLTTLVSDISSRFFSKNSPYKLSLLSAGESKEALVAKTVTLNLIEDAKNSLLATPGVFNGKTEYYDGLTDDFINFVNLVTSIKPDYAGLAIDPVTGEVSSNLKDAIDPASSSKSFFGNFFFAGLPRAIESNPLAKLCLQKFMLLKFKRLFFNPLSTASSKTILLPEAISANPKAAAQIDAYFKQLQNTCHGGIQTAVDEIDTEILSSYGDSTRNFTTFVNEEDPTVSATTAFYIPGTHDKEYEKVTELIGNRAMEYLARGKNIQTANRLFLEEFAKVPVYEEGEKGSKIYTSVINAIDLISTAINLKAAQTAFTGDKKAEETLTSLIKKYMKEGNDSLVADLTTKRNMFEDLLARFEKESQFRGTSLINYQTNRIDNPVLAQILDKFDAFISEESLAKSLVEYAQDVAERKASGTWDISGVKEIIAKTGIMYKQIAHFKSSSTKKEAPEEITEIAAKQSLFDETNPKALKFKFEGTREVVKEFIDRVFGRTIIPLGRDAHRNANEAPVESYNERISKLVTAVDLATSVYVDFYNSIKEVDKAEELKVAKSLAEFNCSKLNECFTIIKHFDTVGIYNVQTQTELLTTIQQLKPHATLSIRDISNEIQDVENVLPNLLKLNSSDDEAGKKFAEKKEDIFNNYLGSRHVYSLMKQGYTLTEIFERVKQIMLEKQGNPEFVNFASQEVVEPEVTTTVSGVSKKVNKSADTLADIFIKRLRFNYPIENSGNNTTNGLDNRFLSRYATLLDPATYSLNLSPEVKTQLVQAASNLLTSLPGILDQERNTKKAKLSAAGTSPEEISAQDIPNDIIIKKIQTTVTGTAGIVNEITKKTVTTLRDPRTIKPVVKESMFNLAKAILEAMDDENNDKKKPFTNISASQNKRRDEAEARNQEAGPKANEMTSGDAATLTSLAAILKASYGVTCSPEAGLMRGNEPFTFTFLEYTVDLLQEYNSSLKEYLVIINKYVEGSDTIEFETSRPGADHNIYCKMFYFNKLKQIVDTFYKSTV